MMPPSPIAAGTTPAEQTASLERPAIANSAPVSQKPAPTNRMLIAGPENKQALITLSKEGPSRNEIFHLRYSIRECVLPKWKRLVGVESAQQTPVKLRLFFNRDGTLSGWPLVKNMKTTPNFLAVSGAAIKAAQACQPFNLPPDEYDLWREIDIDLS